MNSLNSKAVSLPLISQTSDVSPSQCCSQEPKVMDFPIGRFMRFLKHMKLSLLLKRITDRRDPQKTRYRIDFILMWALSVFFFRTESLNELQQSFNKVPSHRKDALWNFFGLPEGSPLPCRQTITDALALLSPEEINALLIQLFKRALKQKVFYNHQHLLGTEFGLACDGFVVHHYAHPHTANEKGDNLCPYCLPRTRHKGTPEEKTYWIHAFVNVAIILPKGIQLPLYVHALKAEQLKGHETTSEKEHKQECELQAAKEILPQIKKEFPRLFFVLQCDSLYANEPLLKLCKDLGIAFLIVRQEGSLKKLAKRCDSLEKKEVYLFYQTQKTTALRKGKVVTTVKWFNGEYVGSQEVHVIRFLEVTYNAEGLQTGCYKTEWLSSRRVSKNNCLSLVETARRRADHEDLHNTLKNRGFNAKHDYARRNANVSLIWKLLMFVGFWIFELFSCTVLAQKCNGCCSWKSFAKSLLIDLLRESWEAIALSPSLCKEHIQFRWNFSQH
jgi:hypothetical protein